MTICTHLQGVALLGLLGALIVCALRLHYLTHRTVFGDANEEGPAAGHHFPGAGKVIGRLPA